MPRKEDQWKQENIYKKEIPQKQDEPAEEFKEEYAAEFVPTLSTLVIDAEEDTITESIDWWNFGVAFTGLVVSAISIYIMPLYLGVLGTALGYLAYMKGERVVTPWTISLGIAGVLIGIFIIPFTT